MPEKEGVIETHVDKLMHLLEQKKYISMAEAAKELGVKQDIVEEWAGFLEEESLLKIKYQLTKPFLQWLDRKEDIPGLHRKPAIPSTESLAVAPKSTTPRSIEALLQKSREKFQSKEFEAAKTAYNLAKAALVDLPQSFLKRKHELEDELFQLHKEFSSHLDKSYSNQIKQQVKTISELLREGNSALKNNQIDRAIQIYNVLKENYLQLPQGFFNEIKSSSDGILMFYQKLSEVQHDVLSKEMEDKTKTIYSNLQQISYKIQNNELDSAHELYNQVKIDYDSLPNGFLEEKIAVQQQMLDAYKDLVLNKKEQSTTDVYRKNLEINELIEEMKHSLRGSQIQKAADCYSKIKQLYSTIPQGFLRNEALIQKNILGAYKLLIDAQQQGAHQSMQQGSGVVDKHLKTMEHYIIKDNLDMALQHYKEAINAYNTLPSGVNSGKVQLRTQLYEQYYNLVSKSDLLQLEHTEPYVKQKYFKLLELLVTAHKAIDSQEFDLLRQVYAQIHTAYHDLPLHLVKQKPMIVNEVNNIYKLFSLYDATLELDRLAQQNRLKELNHKLQKMKIDYDQAEIDNPQDKQLLNYIETRYNEYSNFFKHQSLQKPALSIRLPASPLIEKREEIIQSLIHAKRQKAMEEIANNNHGAAIPHLRTLLELDPNNMEARYMLDTARSQLQK